MALIPRLRICSTGNCTLLNITDVTGVGEIGDNSSKWYDTENPNNITSATLTIQYPNETEDEYDITKQIPDIIEGSFSLGSFAPVNGSYFVDGMYRFIYKVTTLNGTFINTITEFLICQISCCVNTYFANLPNKMCENCDYEQYLRNALKMNALLKSLRSAISSGLIKTAKGLLKMLQDLCDWDECNCK